MFSENHQKTKPLNCFSRCARAQENKDDYTYNLYNRWIPGVNISWDLFSAIFLIYGYAVTCNGTISLHQSHSLNYRQTSSNGNLPKNEHTAVHRFILHDLQWQQKNKKTTNKKTPSTTASELATKYERCIRIRFFLSLPLAALWTSHAILVLESRNLHSRVTLSSKPLDRVTSPKSVWVGGYSSPGSVWIALFQRAISTFKLLTEEFQVKKVKARNFFTILRAQLIAFLLDTKFAKFHDIMKILLKACFQGKPLRSYPLSHFVVIFVPKPFPVLKITFLNLKYTPPKVDIMLHPSISLHKRTPHCNDNLLQLSRCSLWIHLPGWALTASKLPWLIFWKLSAAWG